MNKKDFLDKLREGLRGLPKKDIDERISFYSEMIDDRMEEGAAETEAVAMMGNIDDIISQILSEYPLHKLVKENFKKKIELKGWHILLIIIGAPLWIPILCSAFSVILSVFMSVWAVIISLWATFGACAVCAVAGIAVMTICFIHANTPMALAFLGAALGCAGMAILLFFVSRLVTKLTVFLTKKLVLWIKSLIIRKERA